MDSGIGLTFIWKKKKVQQDGVSARVADLLEFQCFHTKFQSNYTVFIMMKAFFTPHLFHPFLCLIYIDESG